MICPLRKKDERHLFFSFLEEISQNDIFRAWYFVNPIKGTWKRVRLVLKRSANGGNLQACISGIYGKRQFWHRKIARVYSALCSCKAKSARAKFIRHDTVLDIHILPVAIRISHALVTVHRLRLMDCECTILLLW